MFNGYSLRRVVIFTSLAALTTKHIIKRLLTWYKLPPGPIGVPILGYVPFLSKLSYLQFTELSKTYGSVFSLRLGPSDCVVISGWPALKEALSKDELLDRPDFLSSFGLVRTFVEGNGKFFSYLLVN